MASLVLPVSGAVVEMADHLRLKMREFRAYQKAVQDQDFDLMYQATVKGIESWSLALDPHDPASMDELDILDYKTISDATGRLINAAVSEKN